MILSSKNIWTSSRSKLGISLRVDMFAIRLSPEALLPSLYERCTTDEISKKMLGCRNILSIYLPVRLRRT